MISRTKVNKPFSVQIPRAGTYDVTNEGDFNAGVDEGNILARDCLLYGGHEAEISPRQILGAEDGHRVHRPLSLQRYSDRQQQVAIDNDKHHPTLLKLRPRWRICRRTRRKTKFCWQICRPTSPLTNPPVWPQLYDGMLGYLDVENVTV